MTFETQRAFDAKVLAAAKAKINDLAQDHVKNDVHIFFLEVDQVVKDATTKGITVATYNRLLHFAELAVWDMHEKMR